MFFFVCFNNHILFCSLELQLECPQFYDLRFCCVCISFAFVYHNFGLVEHSPNQELAPAFVNKLSTGEKQVGTKKKRQLEQTERRYSEEAEEGCSEGNLEKVR
jgi:hypothetical protein